MAERLNRQDVAEKAIIHEAPALTLPATIDRTFELPAALYVGTAGGYLGFLALMTMTFGNPGLVLPMAIFVLFILMGFGVAGMWMWMKPDHPQALTAWSRFRQRGIMTAFGHASSGAAAVQVLLLPALVFVWGLAIATIAAVVR